MEEQWRDIDPRAQGRPARRYNRLTPHGLHLARSALARASSTTPRPAWLRPVGEQP
jgi:PadR family transcriptional regulator